MQGLSRKLGASYKRSTIVNYNASIRNIVFSVMLVIAIYNCTPFIVMYTAF